LKLDTATSLLGAGVLGDGLGALTDGVLGQLSRQKQTHSGLDFSAGDGGTLVVVGKTAGLSGDPLEDVIHEGVHDGHGLAGDSSVRVHLLQDLVHVDGIALLPLPLALLVPRTGGFSLGGCLLGSLGAWLGWHLAQTNAKQRMVHTTQQTYLYEEICKLRLQAAHPQRGSTQPASEPRSHCAVPIHPGHINT